MTAHYATAGTFSGVGYILAQVGPPLATRQGGGLKLRRPNGVISLAPGVPVAVSNVSVAGSTYPLDWVPLCGWGSNGPVEVRLTVGQTQQVSAVYEPLPARLEGNGRAAGFRLGLSGAVGMSYRIEWTTNLGLPNSWTTNQPAYPISNCLPVVLPGLEPAAGASRFFRAVPARN